MYLHELKPQECATITAIEQTSDAQCQHIFSLGLFEGEHIQLMHIAPFGDPILVKVGHTLVSMRQRDAACIHITNAHFSHLSPEPAYV